MYFAPRGEGEKTAGFNAPGALLVFLFFGGHLPQTSSFHSAKQILFTSFATQVRGRILSGRNIFCTLGEGQQRRGIMPLVLFSFSFLFSVFLVVTCPRPPAFARLNKYLLCLSLHRLGLVSWVAVIYFAP